MSEHKRREKQLAAYLAERDALFRDPNPQAALAHWKKYGYAKPVAPSVPLAVIHKARLQWLDATDAMLQESREWLEAHAYETDLRGAPPLTPETRDAQRKALGRLPLGVN
jgi:hypothetical protein